MKRARAVLMAPALLGLNVAFAFISANTGLLEGGGSLIANAASVTSAANILIQVLYADQLFLLEKYPVSEKDSDQAFQAALRAGVWRALIAAPILQVLFLGFSFFVSGTSSYSGLFYSYLLAFAATPAVLLSMRKNYTALLLAQSAGVFVKIILFCCLSLIFHVAFAMALTFALIAQQLVTCAAALVISGLRLEIKVRQGSLFPELSLSNFKSLFLANREPSIILMETLSFRLLAPTIYAQYGAATPFLALFRQMSNVLVDQDRGLGRELRTVAIIRAVFVFGVTGIALLIAATLLPYLVSFQLLEQLDALSIAAMALYTVGYFSISFAVFKDAKTNLSLKALPAYLALVLGIVGAIGAFHGAELKLALTLLGIAALVVSLLNYHRRTDAYAA